MSDVGVLYFVLLLPLFVLSSFICEASASPYCDLVSVDHLRRLLAYRAELH